MLALSIQQPWAWAILHLGKDVENRTWPTGFRGRFQIHAGKQIDKDGVAWLWGQGYDVPADLPTGAFLGEATLTHCVRKGRATEGNPWAFGPWCFLLADTAAYDEPIPGRGRLQFFEGVPIPEGE